MMREMTPAEIADHDARMAVLRAQMPPDVVQAIRTLRHWASMPDGWEERADRAAAVHWFIDREEAP